MADLIDRQVFIEGQCNSCDGWCEDVNCDCLNCKSDHRCDFIKDLADEPAVDAVEMVHGRWEKMGEADYKCSVCGFRFTSCDPVSMFLYCRCGAKMDEERREENAAD